MARRTWAQLLAGLADNNEGSITAEDVRSVVDSVRPNVTSSAPTTGNDSSAGYDVGSGWLDTSEPALYECRNASVGAAVWVKVWPQSGGGGDGSAVDINAQTGTTYTLVLGDAGKLVTLTNGSPVTVTVPTNASVAYPTGTVIALAQLGAGLVTVEGDTGVTINGTTPGDEDLAGQWATATLTKLATNTWLLSGGLA